MVKSKLKKINNKGFTLIELIICIAIIAILASTMAVAFTNIFKNVRKSNAQEACMTAAVAANADQRDSFIAKGCYILVELDGGYQYYMEFDGDLSHDSDIFEGSFEDAYTISEATSSDTAEGRYFEFEYSGCKVYMLQSEAIDSKSYKSDAIAYNIIENAE